VYYRLNGPGLLVLHELPGFTPQYVAFCNRLYLDGFSPIMPVLFGEPCQRYDLLGYPRSLLNRDFRLYASRQSHPITHWLRNLAEALPRVIPNLPGPETIGVIGMCLTGILPLALLDQPRIVAPVLSQPAIPIPWMWPWPCIPSGERELGLSDSELKHARTRLIKEDMDVLVFRFGEDCLSPQARYNRLQEELGNHFLGHIITSATKADHALFTDRYCDQDRHPTKQAYLTLTSFLHKRLRQ
jgi:dienelactone hydrolase